MPDMQQPEPASPAGAPAVMAASASWSSVDFDYALGCECADPALQIDWWPQEASAASELR